MIFITIHHGKPPLNLTPLFYDSFPSYSSTAHFSEALNIFDILNRIN